MNSTLPASEGAPLPRSRQIAPPIKVWVTLASLATAISLVRYGWLEVLVGDVIDHAVRNIITLILVFTGLVSLLIWFLKESTFAPRIKKSVAGFLVFSIILALAILRIEGVSGDLVPEFAFRWQARRDSLLPSAATLAHQSSNNNMSSEWTATADDFPRFLGPEGTASLDGVELDRNWQANPPQCIWRRPIGAGWSGFATYGNHAVTLEQRK